MKSVILCTFVFVLLVFGSVHAQTFLNLDFEKTTSIGSAKGWYQGGDGYSVFVDTTVYYSGKKSLCILKTGEGSFGVATNNFPIKDAGGKSLKFTGYIKSENITDGYAGLWWRVDGENKTLNFDNMGTRGVKGTTNWTKYTIELKIDKKLTNINFGVLMPGKGKAWFDHLEIELDGVPYTQTEPQIVNLSAEQTNWLKKNITTFKTADPKTSNEDLCFLKDIVGSARIVSLGEGTHGTSEFFKMKHRITKYLAEEMGFTIFAIEANMPEAKAVNDYILNGTGDPRKALEGLYFWTWNTQEVLDMIEWMRGFNASKKGRIQFVGFDMQTPDIAVKNTLDFLAGCDTIYFKTADENYKKVLAFVSDSRNTRQYLSNSTVEPFLNYAKDVYNHLTENSGKYNLNANKDTIEWIIQNARIVVQCLEGMMQNIHTRDESMAQNVEWVLSHSPAGSKIVLWAHNGHVTKSEKYSGMMGTHLNKIHGKEMVVVGFGFNEGDYTAWGKNGVGPYSTSSSEPGSIEWYLNSLKEPRLFLDLRKISSSPLSALFNSELEFRNIGAMAMDYAFAKTIITNEFDVLIYFDHSTPSDCFRKNKK